tara:strand:- start:2311 stop:3192 length:882 start_codon:yes stop_codon:yes gene_type:complete
MSDEQMENPEVIEESGTPEVLDLDQTVKVGGNEYSLKELADSREELENLKEQNGQLSEFRNSTMRLMNPETDMQVKKEDARRMLLSAGYEHDQVEDWVKIYDEEEPTMSPEASEEMPEMKDQEARQATRQMQNEINRMRAQNLKSAMETSVSSAVTDNEDAKVLIGWIESTRSPEDLSGAKERIAEQVRATALENLRRRRDAAGTFEDSWLAEEVNKAASKVSKDMLTVIGDTSKIGRVSETAGQTETLSQRKPVELPSTKDKSYGDVEGQLRDWTSDQILRSLSDPGGDSKA